MTASLISNRRRILIITGVLTMIAALVITTPAPAAEPRPRATPAANPLLVIGHRGASGYRPEHTLASYRLAIAQCADSIEPDVVISKDGVLVVRHENEISGTTDVADHLEFRDRRTTKIIDGHRETGWFTEDFTLAELRTLRAVERLPELRPQNVRYDGRYQIPTLDEVLDLATGSRSCSGRPVGVVPETKHPSYFASIGRPLESHLLAALRRHDLDRPDAPVIIQSFESGNLRRLDGLTDVRLLRLLGCGDTDETTPAGLSAIARYADDVGLCTDLMITRDDGRLGQPTGAVQDAHAAGLRVIGWTFRAENTYLPTQFRRGDDPAAYGDLSGQIRAFRATGMDGFFTDQPDRGVAALRPRVGRG